MMKGMRAGIAAVITDVFYTIGRSVVKEKNILPICIMAAAFVAVYFFKVNVMIIILAAGAIGWGSILIRLKNQKIKSK